MFAAANVQWPSLGFYPGFKSLATDPGNEFDPPYKTLGDVILPGGSTVPFPMALDLSGSVSIAGFQVPTLALVGGGLLLGLTLLHGGKGRRR